MKIEFKSQTLILPEVSRQTISSETPQLAFVRSHKSDIQKEMGAIWAITEGLTGISGIYDLMAGSGFSGKIFKIRFPNCKLLLNDLNPSCAVSLKANFPKDTIRNTYAHTVDAPFPANLIFVDFNNLTMRRFEIWRPVFDMIAVWDPEYYLYTDSACFGFKFAKNMVAYGVKTPEAYYADVDSFMKKSYGWNIRRVCVFGNAALILLSKKPCKEMKFLTFQPIQYSISEEGGLF